MENSNTILPLQEEYLIDEDIHLIQQRRDELEQTCQEEAKLPFGFYYDLDNGNLMFQPQVNESRDPPSPIHICSKLEVIACTRNDANEDHGRLLKFADVDGYSKEWAMPMELLAGDGTQYRATLLSLGLEIAPGPKSRQLLTTFIQSTKPKSRVRCVSKTGWHKGCFVLPDETIGNFGEEKLILQGVSLCLADYETKGSLDDWTKNVSLLCQRNPLLMFACSAAFAPPLLQFLNYESGGFHFRGASSTGKTTTLTVSASVWGGKNNMQRWRATTNGIEAMAVGYNDALLCLDEISQVDPDNVGEIAYMLANGSGKARADKNGFSRKKAEWRLLFLSTGEISLSDHIIEGSRKSRAGQEVRIVDIPADSCKFGVFNDLHGFSNGSDFSAILKRNCNETYGVASREFLRNFTSQQNESLEFIRSAIERFMSLYLPSSPDGQVRRVAHRFAIVAASGELATSFGITGWEENEAMQAIGECFKNWIEARGGNGAQEEQAAIAQVRQFFELHGESRFTPWYAENDNKTINRAGYRKEEAGETEYYVFPETFKKEICKGFDPAFVSKICIKYGLLSPGSNGESTRSERLPRSQKNSRCYRFIKVLADG